MEVSGRMCLSHALRPLSTRRRLDACVPPAAHVLAVADRRGESPLILVCSQNPLMAREEIIGGGSGQKPLTWLLLAIPPQRLATVARHFSHFRDATRPRVLLCGLHFPHELSARRHLRSVTASLAGGVACWRTDGRPADVKERQK